MRALDLGSGPGDVSFQLAEMVGPDGFVVGLEQDPAQIAVAEGRRAKMGPTNVVFRRGDARTFTTEEPFDAVVCRLLLTHLPDAGDVLAHQMCNLSPGGVLVAVDFDAGNCRSLPEVPLFSQVIHWLEAGFRYAEVDPFIGMRFPLLFRQLDLEAVGSMGIRAYFPPEDRHALGRLIELVRTIEGTILASGVVTADELDVDTLEQRLDPALRSANAVFTLQTVVGGWGRRPAHPLSAAVESAPATS